MSKPTVGSLFSGVGGFDLGLERAGFEVRWQVEIDPFCNQVLAKHWPEVTRLNDVNDFTIGYGNEQQFAYMREPYAVELICGGFPCQDLSVAGKRAGLAGDRSGLWFEFHRILSELRPKFCLIENVPGLLSSNDGRDFGVVLTGLGQLWPAVGWAVLDSRHFGVPQRRRRVYIVGGPTRASVQQVLSLCEGGDWHPQKGREAGEDVAGGAGDSLALALNAGRGIKAPDTNTYIADTLSIGANQTFGFPGAAVAHTLSADGFDASEDGTGRGTPLVAQPLRSNRWGGSDSHGDQGNAVLAVRTANTGANGHGIADDVTHTLDGANGQAVAGASVRRLTPVECERLQGFPDQWTQVDDRTADGPRYRALGNAVTVPVIEYLGLRLLEALSGLQRKDGDRC